MLTFRFRKFSHALVSIRWQPIFAAAILSTGLSISGASRAQSSPSPARQTLQVTSELVKIDVSVAGKAGLFVAGLTQKDFRIFDNGVERPTLFFAPTEEPARMLLMIETGPAVYLIHDEHLTAAYALLKGLDPNDQVALVSYDEAPREILPFSTDKSVPLAAIGGAVEFDLGMAQLNFYDSLSTVLDWLKPIGGKRAVVLLTTGLDSSQPSHWSALAQKLQGEDVVIFPVALGGSLRGYSGKITAARKTQPPGDSGAVEASSSPSRDSLSFAKADRDLRALASITGGRAYFPQSENDFSVIYREIASILRHQYVLGIEPAHDGQTHVLTITVAPPITATADDKRPPKSKAKPGEYHVLARQGYLAPAP